MTEVQLRCAFIDVLHVSYAVIKRTTIYPSIYINNIIDNNYLVNNLFKAPVQTP